MTGTALVADAESFRRFHTVDLPERIAAGNGALAWADVEPLGCLGLRTPAGSWTFVPRDGTVHLVEGEEPADTVILAVGVEAERGLVDALAGLEIPVHEIGDCARPGRVLGAIHDGARVGRSI